MAKSDIWFREATGQWYLNIWDAERQVKIKKALGTNKRRAEEIAAQVRAQMISSSLGIKAPGRSQTFDEFIHRFVKDRYEGKPKRTLQLVERTLRQFHEFAGNIRLAAIDKGLLQRYVAKRLQDRIGHPFRGASAHLQRLGVQRSRRVVTKATVNREIAVLLCLMNRAVEWGVLEFNPLAGFRKFSEKDRRRKRYLHPAEITAFLKAAAAVKDKAFLDIVLIGLYTGRRQGEVLRLRKVDYDQKNGYLLLARTKKGEADLIPVPPTAQAVLDRRSADVESEWLFPNGKGTGPLRDIREAFLRAKNAAGLANFRFHDLRHTAIAYQVMAGVDFFSIAQLAGHTTPTMIETRYGHLSPKHREATSALFGAYMDRLTGLGAAQGPQPPVEAPIVAQVADILSGQAAWHSGHAPTLPPPSAQAYRHHEG